MKNSAPLLMSFLGPLAIGAIVFGSAGRWDFPFVWAVLAMMGGLYAALALCGDPGLIRERVAPGGANRDRLTRPLSAILLIAHWVVGGLDIGRFHWSAVPWGVQLAGTLGYGAALLGNFWAMRANRFYSSAVRVQTDRGQYAVEAGPYRFVRHPGYAATLSAMLAGGVALGSWWAMLPMLGLFLLFLRRTLFEDRMLHAELPGYADYAQRVRWRLLPGVF